MFALIYKEIHLIVGLMSVITDMAKCCFSTYHITSIMRISFILGHSYTLYTFKSSFFSHLGLWEFPLSKAPKLSGKEMKEFLLVDLQSAGDRQARTAGGQVR